MEQQINYTALLEKEYGSDQMAVNLIKDFREDLKMSDEAIYKALESFY